ncbi:hypothetical protein [Pelagibius sp.]|uniref:hypothetical protein n=1 Tax=Pelagibius sp. TaxID=1931238 RepID=UPI003BAFB9A6
MLEELMGLPPLQRFIAEAFDWFWFLGALLSWLAAIVYWIRVPFNAEPGSLRGWLRFNPLSVVFYGERLTPKGLLMRKRLLISVVCFCAFLALSALSGMVAKVLA